MDLIQHGESSKSPRLNGTLNGNASRNADEDVDMDGSHKSPTITKTELILPQWDVPPPRPLHASLDLISLLHLDELYNTYVRPYADLNTDDGNTAQGQEGDQKGQAQGKKKQFRKRMDKGYQHLIEDCIDPTPLGTKGDNHSLLPLIPDLMNPPTGPPPALYPEPLQVLSEDMFKIARLEAGLKQDGYAGGVKVGVREAEERRKRRRAAKASTVDPALPSPGLAAPSPSLVPSLGALNASTPGTPLLPVLPPQRPPFTLNVGGGGRRPPNQSSLPPQGARPFPLPPTGPGSASGPPGNAGAGAGGPRRYSPKKRPSSSDLQSGSQQKRAKSSGLASRSASPMPQGVNSQGGQQGGAGGGMGQAGNRIKPSMRSKTEDVR
ncbi:hypothetical protein CI109_102605 [Kwoniella shandongensis]|uniref:Uncharacterized protein n=1 Tax=Kwoniella shandongensis TaxID=1734106 RepID=A0A5M6BU84_9TREE|nr:uncharacterized protein CI109_005187 [Kwoniella shandongensis]KAA5526418.1 hypothetical protein CI109_005187 [Kwoniella shandongensis]